METTKIWNEEGMRTIGLDDLEQWMRSKTDVSKPMVGLDPSRATTI